MAVRVEAEPNVACIRRLRGEMEHHMQNPLSQLPFQVDRVWAKGFRSIADTSIELDALTVLVGPNATGKSNVLDILRFIKDAFRFNLETAFSIRHGVDAVRRQDSGGKSLDIELGLSAFLKDKSPGKDRHSIEYGFVLSCEPEGRPRVTREYGKVWQGASKNSDDPVEFRIENGNLVAPESFSIADPDIHGISEYSVSSFDTSDLSLHRLARNDGLRIYGGTHWEHEFKLRQSAVLNSMLRHLSNLRIYHIFPNIIREPQKVVQAFPMEEDAKNLATSLRNLGEEKPDQMIRLKESLRKLIPGVSDLEVTPAGGYLVVRLMHENGQGGTWLDLTQESDGTVRLLGLMAALFQSRHLPLIGLEEPELTVHPGALAVLADLLNEFSRRTQVIITTHSPDLIDQITDYRNVESLRIVELLEGETTVRKVLDAQKEAVKGHLFSPGELHRMGELELPRKI